MEVAVLLLYDTWHEGVINKGLSDINVRQSVILHGALMLF